MNMFATGYQEISRKRFLSVNSLVRSGCIQYKSEELKIGVTQKGTHLIMLGREKMPQTKLHVSWWAEKPLIPLALKWSQGKLVYLFLCCPTLLPIIKSLISLIEINISTVFSDMMESVIYQIRQ